MICMVCCKAISLCFGWLQAEEILHPSKFNDVAHSTPYLDSFVVVSCDIGYHAR